MQLVHVRPCIVVISLYTYYFVRSSGCATICELLFWVEEVKDLLKHAAIDADAPLSCISTCESPNHNDILTRAKMVVVFSTWYIQ